jgi:hypothetical protein
MSTVIASFLVLVGDVDELHDPDDGQDDEHGHCRACHMIPAKLRVPAAVGSLAAISVFLQRPSEPKKRR